jgi:hypothetical protein
MQAKSRMAPMLLGAAIQGAAIRARKVPEARQGSQKAHFF